MGIICRVGGPTTGGSYGYLRVQDVFAAGLVRRSAMTKYESRTDHMMEALILQALDSPSRMVSVIGSICAQCMERIIHRPTLSPPPRMARGGDYFKVHWSRRSRIFSLFDHCCRTQSFMKLLFKVLSCKRIYSAC